MMHALDSNIVYFLLPLCLLPLQNPHWLIAFDKEPLRLLLWQWEMPQYQFYVFLMAYGLASGLLYVAYREYRWAEEQHRWQLQIRRLQMELQQAQQEMDVMLEMSRRVEIKVPLERCIREQVFGERVHWMDVLHGNTTGPTGSWQAARGVSQQQPQAQYGYQSNEPLYQPPQPQQPTIGVASAHDPSHTLPLPGSRRPSYRPDSAVPPQSANDSQKPPQIYTFSPKKSLGQRPPSSLGGESFIVDREDAENVAANQQSGGAGNNEEGSSSNALKRRPSSSQSASPAQQRRSRQPDDSDDDGSGSASKKGNGKNRPYSLRQRNS